MKILQIRKIVHEKPKQFYDVINAYPFNNFLIKTNSKTIVSHNCNFTDKLLSGCREIYRKILGQIRWKLRRKICKYRAN